MTESIPSATPRRSGFLERLLYFLARVIFWTLAWPIYRIRVVGREHLPHSGPALIVCNHVSWMDGLFLAMCVRRPVRFLVWAPITRLPILHWILKLARAIPIDPTSPRSVMTSLREASAALQQGELVGVFAEGSITRTGLMLPFHRGMEAILKRAPAPIIPACLDRLWGSIFSFQAGKFFWKRPQRFPYHVTVAFGTPLPAHTEAWQIRQAVQELLASSFELRRGTRKPAHRQFVNMACRHPFRSCMVDGMTKRSLNYLETLTGTVVLSRKLKPKLGDAKMVGLLLPTTLGGALANLAVTFLGKVAVNLNYTASKEAVASAIQQCEIRHIVTSRGFRSKINYEPPAGIEVIDLEDLMQTVTKFERTWTYLKLLFLPGFITEYVTLGLGRHTCNDLATIIFSSGSTGDPKGVILSQHNIVSNCESVGQAIDPLPSDRIMAVLPFFHSFGYTVTLWLPLLLGASVVYYPDPRQAKEIGDFIREYGATIFITTPTFLRLIHRRCAPEDFKKIKYLVTGAEKLPLSFAEQFKEKFGFHPLEGYGCTELSPVVSVNVQDYIAAGHKQIGQKLGTIGLPVPGVAVKIVDTQTMERLPPGQSGLLLVKGPNVMVGYLHRPELTSEVIQDGWYVTGDIALLDDDGFIKITDRLSRFSKIGGEMVPHQRVEDELQKIANTTDRVFAVAAVPDEKKGERLVVLYAKLEGMSVKDVYDHMNKSGLPNLWLPDQQSYFEVPEIPTLASGKLDLRAVKRRALELTGS